jgi:hypothetical protein
MTKAFGFSLLVLAALPAAAQVGELGITGGVTYYIGDLNPYRHYPKNTHPGFGLMYRYNFNERYASASRGFTPTWRPTTMTRRTRCSSCVIWASAVFCSRDPR